MRISDWSSDVCSSDLSENGPAHGAHSADDDVEDDGDDKHRRGKLVRVDEDHVAGIEGREHTGEYGAEHHRRSLVPEQVDPKRRCRSLIIANRLEVRSEEHTSELQSLMRISYAVFCLKKKINNQFTNEQST